ncbi:MAG: protein-disulfide reductase DsbD domain-containing protein [Roseobacter sp.]
MKLSISLCTLAVFLAAQPVNAQHRLDTPVKAEVLEGWTNADGSRTAALKLDLAPGWKTYWRAPGDAGIPPQFDWSGSRNFDNVSISWPAPIIFEENGMRSVGYKDTLVIPLRIQPGNENEPVRLVAQMDLGVCADICVPYALSFDAELINESRKPTPAIAAALAQLPYTEDEARVRGATCLIAPTSDGLQIEARVEMPSAGGPEHAVIELGGQDIWVSEAKTTRYGMELVAVSDLVSVSGGPISLDRSAVRITVLGSDYAVDVQGCTSG